MANAADASAHGQRGHHLRRIETVMQRQELSLIAKSPRNQQSLITEGQPLIVEVAVTETQSSEKQPAAAKK